MKVLLKTLGVLSGMYGAAIAFALAVVLFGVIRLGFDGAIAVMHEAGYPQYSFFILIGLLIAFAVLHLCVMYSFLKLRRWGRYAAIVLASLLIIKDLHGFLLPGEVNRDQLSTLAKGLSSRWGISYDPKVTEDIVSVLGTGISLPELFLHLVILGGVIALCFSKRAKELMCN